MFWLILNIGLTIAFLIIFIFFTLSTMIAILISIIIGMICIGAIPLAFNRIQGSVPTVVKVICGKHRDEAYDDEYSEDGAI